MSCGCTIRRETPRGTCRTEARRARQTLSGHEAAARAMRSCAPRYADKYLQVRQDLAIKTATLTEVCFRHSSVSLARPRSVSWRFGGLLYVRGVATAAALEGARMVHGMVHAVVHSGVRSGTLIPASGRAGRHSASGGDRPARSRACPWILAQAAAHRAAQMLCRKLVHAVVRRQPAVDGSVLGVGGDLDLDHLVGRGGNGA